MATGALTTESGQGRRIRYLDLHCHVDQIPSARVMLQECQKTGIAVLGVTNHPNDFFVNRTQFGEYGGYLKWGLGIHPLNAPDNGASLSYFRDLLPLAEYVGEIGLDGTVKDQQQRNDQLRVFLGVQSILKQRPRIQSVHSRKAERQVLDILLANNAVGVIWHWYSGPTKLVPLINDAGHFFSVNRRMLLSRSGRELIGALPRDRILTESDGPFGDTKGQRGPAGGLSIPGCVEQLAAIWGVAVDQAAGQVLHNFKQLVSLLEQA